MSTEPIIRTFADALSVMEDGQLICDLTAAQQSLIAALHDAALNKGGKPKGSISLKLEYSLEEGMVEIHSDIKAVEPKTKRARTMMWVTPENNLSRSNPKQRGLFEDVNASDGRPVRTA